MSMKTQDNNTSSSAHKFALATGQASHEEQKMSAAKNAGKASRKANQ